MNFSIVTGCTPDYLKKLKWTLPTWNKKPQFKNKPLIIFYSGLTKKHFKFVDKYFKNVTLVDWKMSKAENVRELMLSSFVLGSFHVNTEYFIKLDADTFFTNDKDVFDEDDFKYDIVSHRWSYTKPGWWIDVLENYFNGKESSIVNRNNNNRKTENRIQSICCLHKTNFVKFLATKFKDKLPVPSHDTVVWFFADRMKEHSWKGKNLKRFGVNHNSNFRKLREEICSNFLTFKNDFLIDSLLNNIQLELTSYCQLKCFNCDRNCGVVNKQEYLPISKLWNFVEASIIKKKKWNRIDLIGGEPTYYPHFKEMFDIIKIYKNKYPKTVIRFSTNGLGEFVKNKLKEIPDWVVIRNSNKKSKNNKFDSYNSAPIDFGEKYPKACSIPWRCGIALNKRGYFLCGAGASVDKVFNLNSAINSFDYLTIENLLVQIPKLCKYCGHSNCKSKELVCVPKISKSWKKALSEFNNGG